MDIRGGAYPGSRLLARLGGPEVTAFCILSRYEDMRLARQERGPIAEPEEYLAARDTAPQLSTDPGLHSRPGHLVPQRNAFRGFSVDGQGPLRML